MKRIIFFPEIIYSKAYFSLDLWFLSLSLSLSFFLSFCGYCLYRCGSHMLSSRWGSVRINSAHRKPKIGNFIHRNTKASHKSQFFGLQSRHKFLFAPFLWFPIIPYDWEVKVEVRVKFDKIKIRLWILGAKKKRKKYIKWKQKRNEKEKRVKVKTFSIYPDYVTHPGTNRAQLAWLWVNFHVHVFATWPQFHENTSQ